jgi:hypothetical protein
MDTKCRTSIRPHCAPMGVGETPLELGVASNQHTAVSVITKSRSTHSDLWPSAEVSLPLRFHSTPAAHR